MKRISLILLLQMSIIMCNAQTNLEILKDVNWLYVGSDNDYTMDFMDDGIVMWNFDNVFTHFGQYYLSDSPDAFFDYTKIEENEEGMYLMVLTDEDNEVFSILEIVSISDTELKLQNSENPDVTITFVAL